MPMPESGSKAVAQGIEHGSAVAVCLKSLNDRADRADRLDQAPERAKQAEENKQTCHIPGNVAGFIKSGCD